MTKRDWQEAARIKPRDSEDVVSDPELSVILPCFNEAENILPIYRGLMNACPGLAMEILFVDDGSVDDTCAAVDRLRAGDIGSAASTDGARESARSENPMLRNAQVTVRLLRFVRNAGHQNALRAGYRAARGRWILSMDADLQHPPEAIPGMLAKAREGFDVVQMVRSGAQKGWAKNLFSASFYRLFNSISDVPITEHVSDFRLISRYVCDILNALPERNLIVRAILPYLGFRTASLPYRLGERVHGQAAYGFRKSLQLGSQALFNFSALPLKLAMRLGLVISILAFAYGVYNVAAKFFSDRNVPGYTDLIASTLFLGGLILVYLGILGRYILVILDHLKRRPEYLLAEEAPLGAAATGNAPSAGISARAKKAVEPNS